MGLREMAIEAHKQEKEQESKDDLKKADDLAVRAETILKDRIGNEFSAKVVSKDPYETTFNVDGIIFKVNDHDVFVVKKCEKCGAEYQEDVRNRFTLNDQRKVLADIGKILSEPHNDFDCRMILNQKKEKELSIDEKLISALKDFIYENSREFGEV